MQKKPRLSWDEPEPFCPPITVYEEPPETVDTQLLNADGTKIYRRPIRNPIGFDPNRWK